MSSQRRAELGAELRAGRLLRWYPAWWRASYGAEFGELLAADIAERPRSLARGIDIARGGLLVRLAGLGLARTGFGADRGGLAGRQLAALACAMAVFLAFATAVWSQLLIGWQWAAPDTHGTRAAVLLMSLAMLAFALLAVAAAVPVLYRAVRDWRRCAVPLLLVLAGAGIWFAGGRHFGNAWPGTGGRGWPGQRWPGRGLVPGGVAAFSWASTLSVSSYWVHPAALARFPGTEIAWMAGSPIAIACLVAGVAGLLRRTTLMPGVLRFEAWLGALACVAMAVFLTGCCAWLGSGGSGPSGLYRAGAIDGFEVVLLGAMAALAVMAARATSGRDPGTSW